MGWWCSAASADLGVGQIEVWQAMLSGLHARFAPRFPGRIRVRGR